MRRSPAERTLLLRRRVSQARSEPHGLSEAAEFYQALIQALIVDSPLVELPALDREQSDAKLVAGLPILSGESIGVDADAIRGTLMNLCEVAERQTLQQSSKAPVNGDGQALPERAPAVARIWDTLADGRLTFDALLATRLDGDEDALIVLATQAGLDPRLLTVLTDFALRPTFMSFADAFADIIEVFGRRWLRPVCPVCGGPPLFAELRDSDQSRHLRCTHCATSWVFGRIQCAHCASDDFHAQSYLSLEGNSICRVDTCAICRHYLKSILAEEPIPGDLLPLEDLLTLQFDVAAQRQGYQRAGAHELPLVRLNRNFAE